MNNFTIEFDVNKRAEEIDNAMRSLSARFDELSTRKSATIQEAIDDFTELAQILDDMIAYEKELESLAMAKLNSIIGNINRTT